MALELGRACRAASGRPVSRPGRPVGAGDPRRGGETARMTQTVMRTLHAIVLLLLVVCSVAVAIAISTSDPRRRTDSGNWPVYGGDPGGSKYSPLKAIDRTNVGTLVEAWR